MTDQPAIDRPVTDQPLIRRLLVANRGEIARRIFATARRLGIETVAIHSDADAAMPFVREADAAVHLPGNSPAETYLRADLVLDAARRTGADAIHPGYGFLSENADFARAVIDAGLAWVGPSPESITAMGSKIEAKKLMAAAGVPVLPDLTPDTATEADLPLLVKASAGGGGRGMRIVRDLADLPGEIEKARAEAESAFGDGTVFVEPYVERGRHVEVQVVGEEGLTHVYGTRDCSLQRRNQKVVEEAPAPGLPPAVEQGLYSAAWDAANAVSYLGAGTVEFLYDQDREQFWFLEMNTRLQVEHTVTEAIFGVDLVELQLAVIDGRRLPRIRDHHRGHSIEVRLYAEDPARDWQPQSGHLTTFEIPGLVEFENPGRAGVRVDSGFESGNEVSTHYDAMLAKVIAWAPTRREAARMLAAALRKARLHGVVTNRDLLVATLENERFLAGEVSTDFFDRESRVTAAGTGEADATTLFAAAVLRAEHLAARRTVQQRIPVGWRNVHAAPRRTTFAIGEQEYAVDWLGGREGYRPAPTPDATAADAATGTGGTAGAGQVDIQVLSASPTEVVLRSDGVTTRFAGVVTETHVHVDGPTGSVDLRVVPRFIDPADQVAEGSLLAPMPGSVISVSAAVGDEVAEGQTILVMEAMKMQHTITAPYPGTVTELAAAVGQQVEAGAVLAVVEPAGPSTGTGTEGDQP